MKNVHCLGLGVCAGDTSRSGRLRLYRRDPRVILAGQNPIGRLLENSNGSAHHQWQGAGSGTPGGLHTTPLPRMRRPQRAHWLGGTTGFKKSPRRRRASPDSPAAAAYDLTIHAVMAFHIRKQASGLPRCLPGPGWSSACPAATSFRPRPGSKQHRPPPFRVTGYPARNGGGADGHPAGVRPPSSDVTQRALSVVATHTRCSGRRQSHLHWSCRTLPATRSCLRHSSRAARRSRPPRPPSSSACWRTRLTSASRCR